MHRRAESSNMGNSWTSVCRQPTTDPTEPAELKEVYGEVKLAVEAKMEETKDTVEDIKDAVEANVEETNDTVEDIKDAVEAKVEETKEVVQEMARAENTTDTPLVVVVENDGTVEAKTDEVKETVEKALEVIHEEDAEKEKPCVTPLTVVFDLKGEHKTVEFTYKPHGFEYEQAKKKATPCCACASSKPQPHVTVSKVVPNEQAASLGMERGAIIRQVNGKEIAELKQMDLFTEHLATLPNEPDSN